MDIADRIAGKEHQIYLLRNLIDSLETMPGIEKKYIQKHYDEIKDLKESIEHDREVQKIEAAASGRKKWQENAVTYSAVIVVTFILIKIFDFIIGNV